MHLGVTMMFRDDCVAPAEVARAAEERGFYSFYGPEHTHLPVGRSEPPSLVGGVELADYRRSLDPYIALASAAMVTERILLGTGIALIAQHDPIVLAKEIATLDHLSGGRFVLGFGYGWNREEMADHGLEFSSRRDVAHETLRCMEALWSQEVAEFHGRYVNLEPSYSWPKPVQQPRVRTLLGGSPGPKLFAAIAEYCDGWMPIGGAGLSQALPTLRQVVAEHGRDPEQLHIVPFGTIPDEGKLDHFQTLGIDEVVLRIPPPLTRDAVLRVLDDYARYVG